MKSKILRIAVPFILFFVLITTFLVQLAMAGPEENDYHMSLEDWPRVDGALACLPFYEEVASVLLDMGIDEARQYVMDNNTPASFKEMAEDQADIVFCLHGSEEQEEYAAENGVELYYEPYALDAFVFFVNKNNPVDSLTLQEIHDIYAGKITNWKDVGGEDEPIIAYQRNEGSGSQTGLYQYVISEDEVAEPPIEQRIGDMGTIIDAVAYYDNAKGALGYSYLYFVTNQHFDEDIKLLKVDGVAPEASNIQSGLYPMVTEYCCVTSNKSAASAREIVDFCTSEAGQKIAERLSYVPVNGDIKREETAEKTEATEDKGISAETEKTYKVRQNNIELINVEDGISEDGLTTDIYLQIEGLADEDIENLVNSQIKESYDRLKSWETFPAFRGIMLELPKWQGKEPANTYTDTMACCNVANLLSVYVNANLYFYDDEKMDSFSVQNSEYLNFDLNTGEQIKITDVFRDGEQGLKYLNDKINQLINNSSSNDENWYYEDGWGSFKVVGEFPGITEDQKFYLSYYADSILLVFDQDTPWIQSPGYYPVIVSIDLEDTAYINERFGQDDICEDKSCNYALVNHPYNMQDSIMNENYNYCFMGVENLSYDYRYVYYESMPENQKKIVTDFMESVQEKAEKLAGSIDEYLPDPSAEHNAYVSAYVSVDRVGNYTNIITSCYSDIFLSEEPEDVFYETMKVCKVFVEGQEEPVKFEDLFVDGYDFSQLGFDYRDYYFIIGNEAIFLNSDSDYQTLMYKDIGCENLKIFQ